LNSSYLLDNGWLQKVENIYILKMFMPFPLRENNCFLSESDEGWVVIDTGVNLEQNREIFTAALAAIGISFHQIAGIYLTHYHHDHSGLAGWLQEICAAPVYLPQPDLITFKNFIDTDSYLERAWATCLLAGWPLELTQQLDNDIKHINPMLKPLPEFSLLLEGDQLSLNGQLYDAISVPGHTDGHIVFHSSASNLLFSGDNVVAHAILHFTDWPHTRLSDPYNVHLTALRQLKEMNCDAVLPGHGKVFFNLGERIDLIISHHAKRMDLTYEALQSPMTAWQLAVNIFNPRDYIHIKRLVLAETLAYLEALVNEGLVERELLNGSYVYHRNSL